MIPMLSILPQQKTPIKASRKPKKKKKLMLRTNVKRRKPKFEVGDLVGTSNLSNTFSNRDTTNWSYEYIQLQTL